MMVTILLGQLLVAMIIIIILKLEQIKMQIFTLKISYQVLVFCALKIFAQRLEQEKSTVLIRAWKRVFAVYDGVKYPIKFEDIIPLGFKPTDIKVVTPAEFSAYPTSYDDFRDHNRLVRSKSYIALKNHYQQIDLNPNFTVHSIIAKGCYILCENSFGLASRLRLLAGFKFVSERKYGHCEVVQVWSRNLECPDHFYDVFEPIKNVSFIPMKLRPLLEMNATRY